MANYTRTISASFVASGLAGTVGYKVTSAAGAELIARTTAGIAEAGSSGVYTANVVGWDPAWGGAILWDDGAGNVAAETFLPYDPAGTGGPTAAQVADAVLSRSFPANPPADSLAGTLNDLPDIAELGTTVTTSVGGVLDTRGVTQSWASRLFDAARWGPTNKRIRVKLAGLLSRFDLYADNGTTVAKTQAASDDGAGNESMGAQT